MIDVGTFSPDAVDYPDIAADVARKVSRGEVDRGILVCGTGLGMCIAANKVHGVRAAPCHDDITAEMSRRHNDSNVLCLSADMLGERLIDRMVEIWLTTPFEGGRHARRVDKITELEHEVEAEQQAKAEGLKGSSGTNAASPRTGCVADAPSGVTGRSVFDQRRLSAVISLPLPCRDLTSNCCLCRLCGQIWGNVSP